MTDTQTQTPTPAPRGKAAFFGLLVLSILVSALTAAAVAFGMQTYLPKPTPQELPRTAEGGDKPIPQAHDDSELRKEIRDLRVQIEDLRRTRQQPEPGDAYVQRSVVRHDKELGGIVYYPVPYVSPPHLTIISPRRKYTITRQDEAGFTWAAGDLIELAQAVKDPAAVALPPPGEFAWEAKGLKGSAESVKAKPIEQTGSFKATPLSKGDVNFSIPYASPPNVELTSSGYMHNVVITSTTATGFKWQNNGRDGFFDNHTMSWKTKGAPK